MEPQEPSSRSLTAPLSTILLLVVAAGSYVLLDPPLSSSRPQSEGMARPTAVSSEDVAARLWQDPFEPVLAHSRGLSEGKHRSFHRIDEIAWAIGQQLRGAGDRPAELLLLPVVVEGGGYAEEGETRIRTRQAVVSALATAGYAPRTESTIGFFEWRWPKLLRQEGVRRQLGDSIPASDGVAVARHAVDMGPIRDEPEALVPFEWFERLDPTSDAAAYPAGAVLVLWLDSNSLSMHPMKRVGCLLRRLLPRLAIDPWQPDAETATTLVDPTLAAYRAGDPAPQPGPSRVPVVRLAMIGPPDSATLLDFLEEDGSLDTNELCAEEVGRDAAEQSEDEHDGEGVQDGEGETAPNGQGSVAAPQGESSQILALHLLNMVDWYLDDGLPSRDPSQEGQLRPPDSLQAPPVPSAEWERGIRTELASWIQRALLNGSQPDDDSDLDAMLASTLRRWMSTVQDSDPEWYKEAVDRWRVQLLPVRGLRRGAETVEPAASSGTATFDERRMPLRQVLANLKIYSPRATAEEILLAEAAGLPEQGAKVARRLESSGRVGAYYSTILRDGALAKALLRELAWRGVDLADPSNRDYVVLISEWDTIYGRSLPRTFLEALEAEIRTRCEESMRAGLVNYRGCAEQERKRLRERVHRYSYLRGLDGISVEEVDSPEGPDDFRGETDAPNGVAKSVRAVADPFRRFRGDERELPAGRSQLDQVRRLADLLERAELDLHLAGNGQIRAIGVLGSDLYDKELLLQALRRRFPRALFFTTDLDARLVHPSGYLWSRNLLIASSFGFSLTPCLQGEIPPFRDGYQTATFLAGLFALGNHDRAGAEGSPFARWTATRCETLGLGLEAFEREALLTALEPRIYEVSRTGAYDLTAFPDDRDPLHRKRRRGVPHDRNVNALLLSLLLAAMLVAPIAGASSWPRAFRHDLTPTDRGNLLAIAAFAVVGAAALWTAIESSNRVGAGEPFAVLEGISVWPTEILRLIATVLSLAFLAVGAANVRNGDRRLVRELGLASRPVRRPRGEPPGRVAHWGFVRQWWRLRRRFAREDRHRARSGLRNAVRREVQALWCARRTVSVGAMRRLVDRDGRVLGSRLWRRYLELGRPGNRFVRMLPLVVIYLWFGMTLVELLGRPNRPFRGPVAETADAIVLWVSVVAFIVLVVFVVDATCLTERFVRLLGGHASRWPARPCRLLGSQRGMRPDDACDLLDLKVVSAVGDPAARLILYPFVVLFVMIFSRLHFFDDWDWPASLVLIFLFAAAYLVACGVLLRRAAEGARRGVLLRLRGRLSRALAAPEAATTDAPQMRLLIEEVEGLRRGAFAPWTRHPILKALLLPFSGIGLVTLLDLLARFG